MSATRWSLQWGQLLPLLLSFLSFVVAEDCIIPKVFPHFITVDMQAVDSLMCYKCYGAPTSQGFQVILHELRLAGLGSVMMYVDGTPRSFTEDCGECETENFIQVDEEGDVNTKADVRCHECDAVPNGTLVELYVRLDAQVKVPSKEDENLCQNLPSIFPNFNLSLNVINYNKQDTEAPPLDCDDGFSVNFPLAGDTCIVNSTYLTAETRCIIPTCSDGVISPDMSNEKIERKFLPSIPSETCVWQLNTEQRKHLTLRFSENIRPHLTVFEETLLNPKWDIEWCPSFSNEFKFETDATSIFIVYHNTQKLSKKGTLIVSAQTDLCLLPPKLENGNVEFKHLGSGTVAYYSCDKGYILMGPSQLHCKSSAWDKPPICLPVDEDKLMSDAPMGSIENLLESVNGSVLITENGTSLASDNDAQGKMPETVTYDLKEDQYEDQGNEEYEDEKEIEEEEINRTYAVDEEVYSNRTMLESIDEDGETTDVPVVNASSSGEVTVVVDKENGDLSLLEQLFNLTMEDDMTLYLIIGAAGLVVLIIVMIITIVVYRKKYPVRLGLGRKFDTFQNPIYEKTVVQMPMQIEETEVGRKKSDAEEMSDCTVLE